MPGTWNWLDKTMRVGNPSSQHSAGLYLHDLIEEARRDIAKFLGAEKSELYFTSGATESANILSRLSSRRIASELEHACIAETFPDRVAGKNGKLNLPEVESALRSHLPPEFKAAKPALAVMLENNETGVSPATYQDLAALKSGHDFILIGDAVASVPYISVNFDASPYDAIFISGHKMHALPGVGVIASKIPLEPLVYGGHQEFGVRPGTENTPGILSLQYAIRQIQDGLFENALSHLPNMINLFKELPYEINGYSSHIINLWVKKPSVLVVEKLSDAGVIVSGGSACNSGLAQPSKVLSEMFGTDTKRASESIRISLSAFTEEAEVLHAVKLIKEAVEAI